MKKTFLLINSIILLVSCSNIPNLSELVEKDGVSYKGDKPYTGRVLQLEGGGDSLKVLEGIFLEGKRDSLWVLWYDWPQGKEWQVTYKNGGKEGLWTEWYENGKEKSKGQYTQDERDGIWEKWDTDGNLLEQISYENGEETRKVVTEWKSGLKMSEGTYNVGKPDGLYTSWYENGQKKSEGTYKDGKINGKWSYWYENELKKMEGNYKDGKKDGKWTHYNKNGQIEKEGNYKDGKEEGEWSSWSKCKYCEDYGCDHLDLSFYKDGELVDEWRINRRYFDNGELKVKETWKDGWRDGLWTWWYENGQKNKEGTYKDGKMDGLWTQWYPNGKKDKEGTFKTGEFRSLGFISFKTEKWTYWDNEGKIKEQGSYSSRSIVKTKGEDGFYHGTKIGKWTETDNTSNYYGYMLHLENTDKFQFQIQEDHSSDGVIASASVTTGVWVHLVGVFDAGNNLKLYKNGCLASTTNTDISTLTATSADFKLGAWSDEIDEVAIWNTALSADAVAAIYNGGAPIDLSENSGDYTSSSNLQGYWRMNEGTGSTVADDSDNSYTGTISGASWSSTVPDYSLSLDGSDDCVSIADADESDGKKRLEEEAESRNGTYTGRDRSSGSTLELTLTLSGNSWSMKTVPFSVDYGYNTQPTAIYDRGIVKGDDLYDESGSFNLGYISSDGNIKFFKNRITLRKR